MFLSRYRFNQIQYDGRKTILGKTVNFVISDMATKMAVIRTSVRPSTTVVFSPPLKLYLYCSDTELEENEVLIHSDPMLMIVYGPTTATYRFADIPSHPIFDKSRSDKKLCKISPHSNYVVDDQILHILMV